MLFEMVELICKCVLLNMMMMMIMSLVVGCCDCLTLPKFVIRCSHEVTVCGMCCFLSCCDVYANVLAQYVQHCNCSTMAAHSPIAKGVDSFLVQKQVTDLCEGFEFKVNAQIEGLCRPQ